MMASTKRRQCFPSGCPRSRTSDNAAPPSNRALSGATQDTLDKVLLAARSAKTKHHADEPHVFATQVLFNADRWTILILNE